MSSSIITFPSAFTQSCLRRSRIIRVVFPRRHAKAIAASTSVASRIRFPSYLKDIRKSGDVVSSQSSVHAFDAVYRNAMDYLAMINREELFRS